MINLNFILVIFYMSSLVILSPVVYIIESYQPAPILLSTGIIATEKYILTTKYPISAYPIPELCAMPATNLTDINENHLLNNCCPIKTAQFHKNIDFGVLELSKEIFFYYGVNTATLPATTTVRINPTTPCYMFYNKRGRVIGQYEHVTSQEVTNAKITKNVDTNEHYIEISTAEEHKFCRHDNGLPLFCKFAIVGILSYKSDQCADSQKHLKFCLDECLTTQTLRVVKIFDSEVHQMVRKVIKEAPEF